MAMINTLQLAVRKNVIRFVIRCHVNSNCHSELSRHFPTTCLDYFVFPYLKNNVFENIPELINYLIN
jgi:hypothetical protein